MKNFTLLICVLVFILAEAEDDKKAIETEARHLVKQLKGASKKYNLDCKSYSEYCNNSQNKPRGITEELCPVIFKAYLCDNVTDAIGMITVLEKFAEEVQVSSSTEVAN